jgi:hypothetical protein
MAQTQKSTPAKDASVDPAGKTEQQVRDELAGVTPPEPAAETLAEPEDTTPPASVYVVESGKPVTMADVAALNGIGAAPDASRVESVKAKDVFVSEGMRNDLELHGWAIDPATGRKVVKAS